MILPTMRQLQYLKALQEHRSFSKAADICAVTQPTLSAGIKELENILGQSLIERTTRSVILSPLGHTLADQAAEILERAKDMIDQASSASEPMTGVLRMGVIPTIAPYLLPDILPRVQKHYPLLELELYEDLSDRLIEALRGGDIDVALIAFPYDTPGLEQHFLFEEEFYLATPKGHDLKDNEITSEDLDPGELLLLEDGHCLTDHALLACNIQLPKRRKAYSATSLSTLLQMVSNAYGITLVPDMAIAARAIPKDIALHRFEHPPPSRKVGLVWRPKSPHIEDFKALGKIIGNTPAAGEV